MGSGNVIREYGSGYSASGVHQVLREEKEDTGCI